MQYQTSYPSLHDLKQKAKKRMPKFAYDFLEGGCTDENSINRNQHDLQQVRLKQSFIRPAVREPNLKTSLCGIEYDLPFGISPVGFQGFLWANMSKILARTAKDYNIPYIMSTFATNSIEEISEVSEGQALFQLYNPQDEDIRKDLLRRAEHAGYRALIVTVDIASQSYRSRELRNGILPPKFTLQNIMSVITSPSWAGGMMMHEGIPKYKSLIPYLEKNNAQEMTDLRKTRMRGSVSLEDLKSIRSLWKGVLIIKGILSEDDIKNCIALGADGVIVSNHGARQLDNGQTSIAVLPTLAKKYGDKIHITFDSGIESGVDIASALASGAEFAFAGRAFCYGVCALGKHGGAHTIEMFEKQLQQVLCQIGCDDVQDIKKYLIDGTS